jgi:hypothetical protein
LTAIHITPEIKLSKAGTHVRPPINEQNEKLAASADHHNTSGQFKFTPSVHGFHDAIDVSRPGFPTPIDTRVIVSTQETAEFPFNKDMNSGDALGIGA